MLLTQLAVKQLRNLNAVKLSFSPTYNIFYGVNGSGKTSLLEAIYYLGLGRSFRTSTHTHVIQQGQDHLSVVGELNKQTHRFKIGVRRTLQGHRDMRLAGQRVKSIAPLAQALPLQVINSQQHALLTAPKARRQYLDWGLFHVEQRFFSSWQSYTLALRQRNAGLRQGISREQLAPWDTLLMVEAQKLDEMRSRYVDGLNTVFLSVWEQLMGGESNNPLQFSYYRGWSSHKALEQVLREGFDSDRRVGYTQLGPHRADLILTSNKMPAKDKLSQGQQKLLVYALKLAQGKLLQEQQKGCLYLMDDLPAELDAEKRANVVSALSMLNAQIFITGVFPNDLKDFSSQQAARLFHVKQGQVEEAGAG